MKLLTIVAVLLASATPASARNIMDWYCGDDVAVSITVSAAHKTGLSHLTHSVEINGLRDPVKDRVTFKLVPSEYGYRVFGAYLNGKRCTYIPYDPNPDPKTALTNSLIGGATQTLYQIQESMKDKQGVPNEVMPLLLRLREAITKAEEQPKEAR
jgi:hypothetical protein